MWDNVDIEELKDKFEPSVFENLDINNVSKIILYLKNNNVTYIDELIMNYLDLFMIDYLEFVKRAEKLKLKYGNDLFLQIGLDMSILDEF